MFNILSHIDLSIALGYTYPSCSARLTTVKHFKIPIQIFEFSDNIVGKMPCSALGHVGKPHKKKQESPIKHKTVIQ